MMNYRLSYKEAAEYTDAMEYLIKHFDEFPERIPQGGPTPEISVAYHKNHRFVQTPEGEIVFGNCIIPGVNAEEFENYRKSMFEPQFERDSRKQQHGKQQKAGGF